jgi:hypothetical protein
MTHLSCLIPLYRSQAYFDIICKNIDTHLDADAEILISDRHGLDDTASRLAVRYAGEKRVRVMVLLDQGDWVTNICGLLLACRGRYLRIIPHDDSASRASTLSLTKALDDNGDAVLASGIVRAVDLQGVALPQLDQLNAGESRRAKTWSLEDALSLFWHGRFQGAFKGVVRADVIRSRRLLIKKTPTLIGSERAWLFGLALVGRFQFVPESVLVKRYYKGSTSSSWEYTPQVHADVARVMMDYCDDLIADATARERAKRSLAACAWPCSPEIHPR